MPSCDDCGRETCLVTVDGNVTYGEDKKRVCADMCIFKCPNGHDVYSSCPIAFEGFVIWDEDYDEETYQEIRRFKTHHEPCKTCGEACVITRNFCFDFATIEIDYRMWRYRRAVVLQRWWRARAS